MPQLRCSPDEVDDFFEDPQPKGSADEVDEVFEEPQPKGSPLLELLPDLWDLPHHDFAPLPDLPGLLGLPESGRHSGPQPSSFQSGLGGLSGYGHPGRGGASGDDQPGRGGLHPSSSLYHPGLSGFQAGLQSSSFHAGFHPGLSGFQAGLQASSFHAGLSFRVGRGVGGGVGLGLRVREGRGDNNPNWEATDV